MNWTLGELLVAAFGFLPGAAVIGAIGAVLTAIIRNKVPVRKVKLEGEAALWERIELLESRADAKDIKHAEDRERWEKQMRADHAECERRIDELRNEFEGQIRQLQQEQQSFGNISDDGPPLSRQLGRAHPVPKMPNPDLDALIDKIK
jgi:hypothetical protein